MTSVLSGVVLKLLWGWYVVTTFGLPTISVVQSIGIVFIMTLVVAQHIPRDEEAQKEMTIFNISFPVTVLAFGWIFHFFL